MTPPVRHNAEQAGKIIGKSASWMYQQGAAGNIPRSKLGHHVWWTDEQLAEILRAAEQQPKPREQQPAEQRQEPAPAKKQQRRKRDAAPANASNIPQADFSVSRLYRQDGAA